MIQIPNLLSILTFLPLVGILLIAFVPKDQRGLIRGVGIGITVLQVLLAIVLWANYNPAMAGINSIQSFQFVERYDWISIGGLGVFGAIKIDFLLGVDGLSITMVLLTVLISFIGSIASMSIEKQTKGYYQTYLLLVTGMLGVFVSLDLFLFFLFYELMLLPMYFLIGIWGGLRREYAAIKFFLYTLLGSVALLLVLIGLYVSTAVPDANGVMSHTLNMISMMDPTHFSPEGIFGGWMTTWRYVGFLALFFAFAVKIPMVPFHTWLPDAHVEAPTAISVVLAGVLLKMGGYGILRLCFGIFPEITVALSWYIAMFGFINIIYGAFCAMAQQDFKRLIAYSSISHMGYVLLGASALNTEGMTGAVFQMFNHGTITALLFLIVGVLYDRTGKRGIYDFGGVATQMPRYFGLAVVGFFAALGLPSLSSFISEVFVFLGAFRVWPIWTALSVIGLILTAGYMLWTLQRIFFGPVPERLTALPDLSMREMAMMVPLALIIIFLGVYPRPVIDLMSTSVSHLTEMIHTAARAPQAQSILK